MSKQLVESIINKDFVLAESYFNDRLNSIMEKKLYEKKRMVASQMDEVLGGMTRAEIEAKKKAGYKKAADVLQDPRDIKVKPLVKVKKKIKEAVDVQPDPDAKVRGGKSNSQKGTFRRKAAAAVLKTSRKVGNVAGDIAVAAKRAREALSNMSQTSQKTPEAPKRKAPPKTSQKKSGYEDTPTGRNRERADKYAARNPPGSAGVALGRGLKKAGSWVLRDIAASIGEETK